MVGGLINKVRVKVYQVLVTGKSPSDLSPSRRKMCEFESESTRPDFESLGIKSELGPGNKTKSKAVSRIAPTQVVRLDLS